MNKFAWALTLVALAGGSLVFADVKTDYSHHFDFNTVKTYSWIKVQAEDSLWNGRIKRAVDSALTSKGWQEVPSGGAASIAAYGSTKNEKSTQTWYDGFGGGWYWGGFGNDGMANTTVENTPVGTLKVDIFNSADKKLIWRGSASDALSGNVEKNEKKMTKEVNEMFKKFPPKEKS